MFCGAFLLACLVLVSCRTAEGLQRDGQNVCVKQRLVRVNDVYPPDRLDRWTCTLYYPNITCERISSGNIDIESVYFLEEFLTCCPGWSSSEDDEDNEDDESESCSLPCEDGYFGENCELECRCYNSQAGCNRFNGTCDCLDGWTGPQCDQRCPPRRYGPNCTLTSEFSCENSGTNHPVTGDCLCSGRYVGLECEIECRSNDHECGAVQCGQCIPHSFLNCDPTINTCRCNKGWRGRYCTDLCPLGYGGEFCEEKCCSQNGRCFRESTGEGELECFCTDGSFGEECENTCPDGRYGRDCEQDCQCPSCDSVTGECEDCPAGFKGPKCLDRCSTSEWGPSCSASCACSDGVACDVFTGSCSDSNFTWLIVCLLLLVCLAVSLLLAYLWHRRQRKLKEERRNEEVHTKMEDNVYHTNGSSQHYTGSPYSTWDRGSTIQQPGSVNSAVYNGSTADKAQYNSTGNLANNPLYGTERIDTIVRKSDQSGGEGLYARPDPHVYDAPAENGPPSGKEGHDYDYLKPEHAVGTDPFETVGPVYHVPHR